VSGTETVTAEALTSLRPPMLAFCYQMLGSPFDAEDAVQDVTERTWRSQTSYDASRASLSTWCPSAAGPSSERSPVRTSSTSTGC
jgi:DNA-directed RNA polymerase specialized sigma24 family protein